MACLKSVPILVVILITCGLVIAGPAHDAGAAEAEAVREQLKKINLPDGFKINLFALVPHARSLAVTDDGSTIIVGSRGDEAHLVRDHDRDGVADVVIELTDDLRVPNGIAVLDGELYIAEQHRIVRWRLPSPVARDQTLKLSQLVELRDGLPDKSHHGWRYLAFGPDRKLYVSIGSPCNICTPEGLEGAILQLDPDGKNMKIYAKGVRNSVGFDWHPKTGRMFFTDNGGDGMGDDVPSDELNEVTAPGQHFGFPYFAGGTDKSPDFGVEKPTEKMIAPVIKFQAHSANLGIHFYTGKMFPAEYLNDAFVAQHGSWNRSSKVGYQVMRIRFNDKGQAVGKEVFASGFLEGERVSGRPVDIKTLSDGSLLVSDDYVGAIYRISYGG